MKSLSVKVKMLNAIKQLLADGGIKQVVRGQPQPVQVKSSSSFYDIFSHMVVTLVSVSIQ